jgi:hypothetical protein
MFAYFVVADKRDINIAYLAMLQNLQHPLKKE